YKINGTLVFIPRLLYVLYLSIVKISFLMGFPVILTLSGYLKHLRDSSKVAATTSTYLDNILFVIPGKAFCSWIIVGMFILLAVYTTGPHTYPPVPITTSGLNSFIICFASLNPKNILLTAFIVSKEIFLGIPLILIVLKAKPSFGTSSLSKLFSVPTYNISASSCLYFISFAIANA